MTPSVPAQTRTEKKALKLIKKGENYYENFQFKDAVNSFKKAIGLLKNKDLLIRAHLNLAKTYYALGEADKTENSLHELFRLNPEKPADESQLPRGFLEVYQRIGQQYPDTKEIQKIDQPKVISLNHYLLQRQIEM